MGRKNKDDGKTLEIEVKGKVPNHKSVEAKVKSMGFSFVGTEKHTDIYFRHPTRDFASTDEALRIRSVNGHSILTYKGPKIDKVSKTREEIEVEFKGDMASVLDRVGFIPVLDVVKQREVYHKDGIEVCLDDVKGLGTYVEVECRGPSKDLEKIRERVMGIVKKIGLKNSDLERRAYLELLLGKR